MTIVPTLPIILRIMSMIRVRRMATMIGMMTIEATVKKITS
jgi:hypothetical protein